MAEDSNKKKLPQVGTDSLRESHSSALEDRPTDSGGDNQPQTHRRTLLVSNQAKASGTTTGTIDESYNSYFKPTKLLSRSPPHHSSVPELSMWSGTKRRCDAEDAEHDDNQAELADLIAVIEQIEKETGGLSSLVKANPTTKNQIKDAVSRVKMAAYKLSNFKQTLQTWSNRPIVTEKKRKTDNDYQRVAQHNIATQTDPDLTQKQTAAKEMSTQTVDIKEIEKKTEELCNMIHPEMTTQDIRTVVSKEWPQKVFRVTKISRNSFMDCETSTRAIFIDGNKPITQELHNLGKQVPGFQQLLDNQYFKYGDVAVIRSSDRIELKGQNRPASDGRTLLVGYVNQEVDDNELEAQFIALARGIRTASQECTELSITSTVRNRLNLRKILECCYSDSGVGIKICVGAERGTRNKLKAETKEKDRKPVTQPDAEQVFTEVRRRKRNPRNRKETVIVKAEGRTYADLLKAVKSGVDIKEIGVEIIAIKKTKTDDLMIQLKGGKNKAECLTESIAGKVAGVTAIHQKEMAVIHIRDLEAGTVSDDVKKGVLAALSGEVRCEEILVTSMRPTHSDTMNATVKLPIQWAKQLVECRRIRIGWISCRVQLRADEHRCYKCWERGHTAMSCNGPDRRNLCFNCGKDGHKRSECSQTQGRPFRKRLNNEGESSPVDTNNRTGGEKPICE